MTSFRLMMSLYDETATLSRHACALMFGSTDGLESDHGTLTLERPR